MALLGVHEHYIVSDHIRSFFRQQKLRDRDNVILRIFQSILESFDPRSELDHSSYVVVERIRLRTVLGLR